jgi:integrase
MATLKAVVRKQRADGLFTVYIRIVHRQRMGYVRTDKSVMPKHVTKDGYITDPVVNKYCADLILHYHEVLNRHDISQMSVMEVIELMTTDQDVVSFTNYAKRHIDKMINSGHERTAKNYKLAVAHLERFIGNKEITFAQLTSTTLSRWIESMKQMARAKEMYPICVRQIFKAAVTELNDEERGIIRIKFNPWKKVQIPKADKAEQKAISAEECRLFFNRPLPETKMLSSLPELGRDVAMLILCLGGINTVDLFNLKKADYHNGVIGYKRAKTRHARSDEAYMEMRVEPFIMPTFEKYLDKTDSEYLMNFHQRYCDSDSFCANANNGIKKICEDMGMAKEDWYCCYTMRHSWATIAQNDCGANLYEVAMGMNHSHGFKVTRGYVKMDFTPAWELNKKIIDFVFFSNAQSKQGKAKDLEEPKDKLFRITPKMMISAKAYYMGEVLAELEDVGFNTVDQVIESLIRRLPDVVPNRGAVQFRIVNKDSSREVVYTRTKGKGF